MKLSPIVSISLLSSILLTAGCAHNISITPAAGSAKGTVGHAPNGSVGKTVGLLIANEDRTRKVTTPGGGGDKITYLPYKDLEGPLFFLLSGIYTNVEALSSGDASHGAKGQIDLILTPKIETTSSSSSVLTWPPTEFCVTINMKASNPSGQLVWEESVTGNGHADFSEFKHDFALAAHRASQAALEKIDAVIRSREDLKEASSAAPSQ